MSRRKLERALDKLGAVPGLEAYAADVLEALADEAGRADSKFERFHWGRQAQGSRVVKVPRIAPGEVLYQLGDLTEIAYDTQKGSPEWVRWVHEFKRPLPALATTQAGKLVIVGGGYRVTERGIVG